MWRGLCIGAGLLLLSGQLSAQEARVSAQDFAVLGNTQWAGVLRYLDYSSAIPREIPVEVKFARAGRQKIRYRIKYPGEEQYNQKEKLKWSKDGQKLDGEPLISRSGGSGEPLVLVTEYTGRDNERPADLRMTYSLSATAIEIRKDVRYANDETFFERNAYVLERIEPQGAADVESQE